MVGRFIKKMKVYQQLLFEYVRYIHSTDAVFDIRDYFSARHLLKESIIHLTSGQIQQLQYGKEF